MAAPHAVGVAALIVAEKGRRLLRKTATDTPCPAQEPFVYPGFEGQFDATCEGTPDLNGFYGDGIVNALGVVQ